MSDLLSILAARDSGASRSIQPRTASLFEPRTSAASPHLRNVESLPHIEEKVEVQTAAYTHAHLQPSYFAKEQQRQTTPSVKERLIDPRSTEQSLRSPKLQSDADSSAEPSQSIGQRTPLAPATRVALLPPERESSILAPKAPTPDAPLAALPRTRETSKHSAATEHENSLPLPKATVTTPASQQPSVLTSDRILKLIQSMLPAPTQPRPQREVQTLETRQPQPEHVVQITIGKIEVRALHEQAAPKKERSLPAVSNLEAYLKQRRAAT